MKPLILLTNDDGIDSPGLLAMAEAAEEFGELLIAAPALQQTSMGRSFPRPEKLGIIKERRLSVNGKEQLGYGIYGSPAYAVDCGVLELAERKPDICLSGINYGENLGTNLTCSGTVGAVLEASTHQIPGIAFSIPAAIGIQRSQEYPQVNWETAKAVVHYWTNKLLVEKEICGAKWLNINMPDIIPPPQEYCYTKQSSQNYFDFLKPGERDFSKRYEYKSVINYRERKLDESDDIYAVRVKKMISVTPILHDLTVPEMRIGFSS